MKTFCLSLEGDRRLGHRNVYEVLSADRLLAVRFLGGRW